MIKAHALIADLADAIDIAERAQCVGAAAGNLVIRPPERLAYAVHLGVDVRIVVRIHEADVHAHQVLEQLVAQPCSHALFLEDQDRGHAELLRRRSGQHGMIRLRAACCEHHLRALRLRLGEEIFELPHLIAAKAEARHVVPLDINLRAHQAADVVKPLYRRRKYAEGYLIKCFHLSHLFAPFPQWRIRCFCVNADSSMYI